MKFKSYDKVERIEKEECDGLLSGNLWVQEKIDGSNASIFQDGNYFFGCSRSNVVIRYDIIAKNISGDFRGFAGWLFENAENLNKFFNVYPNSRLLGEWLVPHKVKYAPEYYKKFYVFEIEIEKEDTTELMPFDCSIYKDLVEYGIPFITPHVFGSVGDHSLVDLEEYLKNLKSDFDAAYPEGIVIKNFDFRNKWGHRTHGKILSEIYQEVKNAHSKPKREGGLEGAIAERYATQVRVEKILHKIIDNQIGMKEGEKISAKHIPIAMELNFRDIITEDMMDILKRFKNPLINFQILKNAVNNLVRQHIIKFIDEKR